MTIDLHLRILAARAAIARVGASLALSLVFAASATPAYPTKVDMQRMAGSDIVTLTVRTCPEVCNVRQTMSAGKGGAIGCAILAERGAIPVPSHPAPLPCPARSTRG